MARALGLVIHVSIVVGCGATPARPVAPIRNLGAIAARPTCGPPVAQRAGLHGIVVADSDGRALVGASVGLLRVGASPSQWQWDITDERGCYAFAASPGQYLVGWYYLDFDGNRVVDVNPGPWTGADLVLVDHHPPPEVIIKNGY